MAVTSDYLNFGECFWFQNFQNCNVMNFAEVRQGYYEAENLQKLFREINVTDLSDFLREIGLFYRIYEVLVHDYSWMEIQMLNIFSIR